MAIAHQKAILPRMLRLDPEEAHEKVAKALTSASRHRRLCRWFSARNGSTSGMEPVELFGLRFPNAVGLAAGFDKNAAFWPALFGLGFGHVEIGTITFEKQPGNPRPRSEERRVGKECRHCKARG